MDYLLCGNLPYPAWKKHISVQNLNNRRIHRYLVCRLKRPEARDFSHVRFTLRQEYRMIEVERERRRWNMGVYLNPGNEKFAKAVQSEIYVDKTGLIEYTNQVINTVQRYVCVSRPRRFGKSMTADMLTAYYGKECDSRELFSGLKISQNAVFAQHLNQYPTIFLNMQEFLSRSKEIGQVIDRVRRMLLRELKNSYPDVDYFDDTDLVESMQDIYAATKQSFVIIIDEWDCVFREYQQDKKHRKSILISCGIF